MKEKHMKQRLDELDLDDEMGHGAGLSTAGKKNPNLKSDDDDPFALPASASKPNLKMGLSKPKDDDKKPTDLKASDLGKLDPRHNDANDSLAGLKNPGPKDNPQEPKIGVSGLSNTSHKPKPRHPEAKEELDDLFFEESKQNPPRTLGTTNPKPKLPAAKDDIDDLMFSDAKPAEPPRTTVNTNLNTSKPNLLPRRTPADQPVLKPLENNSTTKPPAVTKPATVTKPPAFDEPLFPDEENIDDDDGF